MFSALEEIEGEAASSPADTGYGDGWSSAVVLGLMLLSLPIVIGVFVGLGLVVNIGLVRVAFPLMVATTAWVALRRFGANTATVAGFVAIVFGAAVVGTQFLDPSSDGNSYHRSAALCLADGWNPIWGEKCGRPWTDDYPMLSWIYAAAQSFWSGSTESGMSINLVVSAGNGLTSAWIGRRLGLAFLPAVMLGIVMVLNPVNMTQMWSSYVDGLTGSYFSVAILAVAGLASPRVRFDDRSVHAIVAVCLVALVSLKFSGLVYAGVAFVGAAVFTLHGARRSNVLALARIKMIAVPYFVAGAATLIISFSPYVRNVIEGEHPLHPVLGEEQASFVEKTSRLACFESTSRFEQPFLAMLYPTSANALRCVSGQPFRSDWSPDALVSDFDNLSVGDWRLSGFGPLMPLHVAVGLALAAVVALYGATRRRIDVVGPIAAVLALTLFSTWLIEPNWWARYVPQLWMLGALPILGASVSRRWFVTAGTVVVFASLSVSGVLSLRTATEISRETVARAESLDHPFFEQALAVRHPVALFTPGRNERSERFGWPDLAYIDRESVACGAVAFLVRPATVLIPPAEGYGVDTTIESLLSREDLQLYVVAKDDAATGLTESQREAFRARNVPIDDLAFRGSFAAAILPTGSNSVVRNDGSVSLASSMELKGEIVNVQLESGGLGFGNSGTVVVDGLEMLIAGRGLGILAFSETGAFRAAFTFDTFSGAMHPTCA